MTDTMIRPAAPSPGPPAPPDRPNRAGWMVVGGVLAALGILWGTVNLVAQLAHEESNRTTTFPAADISELVVDSDAGLVEVTGADAGADTIIVRAHITEGLVRPTDRQEVVNGRLELTTTCPRGPFGHCNIAYRVSLPADRAVTIQADDGDVRVTNVDGLVRVENDNGSITLADIGGDLTVTNDHGRIEASGLRSATVDAENDNGGIALSFAVAPQTVTVRNDNGPVTVEVPDDDAFYAVELHSDNGDTTADIRTDPSSDRRIEVSTRNADVRVRYG